MEERNIVGTWEEYNDEHILLIRTLDQFQNNRFEYVYANSDPHRYGLSQVGCLHGVIDMRDYLDYEGGLEVLDKIARGQDYQNFDDMVLEGLGLDEYNPAHGVVLNSDMSINKAESSAYVVDLPFTASLIVEHLWSCMDGDGPMRMSHKEAIRWAKNLTGKEYQEI